MRGIDNARNTDVARTHAKGGPSMTHEFGAWIRGSSTSIFSQRS